MNRAAMTKTRLLAAAALLVATLAACGGETPADRPPLSGAKIGGPFELVDKTGRTVRWSQFDGKYRIIYFGYTYCPDVCPLDMQSLMRALARFDKEKPALAAQVQPIFITIDPERDTPQAVGEFAAGLINYPIWPARLTLAWGASLMTVQAMLDLAAVFSDRFAADGQPLGPKAGPS